MTLRGRVVRLVDRAVERFPAGRRERARQRLRRFARPAFLTARRIEPVSRKWGYDRGKPIDRYYIERFLGEHRRDIRGRVLEVKEPLYTERFGTGVEQSDVLDIDSANPRATIVADLAAADRVESESFDCFILTQTLQLIPEPQEALRHAHRLLRAGGVLLATVPVLSPLVGAPEEGIDFWRFTPASCRRLLGAVFGADAVEIHSFGNVRTAVGFLRRLAVEDLNSRYLDVHDERIPMLIGARAVKT